MGSAAKGGGGLKKITSRLSTKVVTKLIQNYIVSLITTLYNHTVDSVIEFIAGNHREKEFCTN